MYVPFKFQQEFAVDTVESRWANLPGVKKNIQPFITLLLIYNRLQKRTLFAEITHEIISGFLIFFPTLSYVCFKNNPQQQTFFCKDKAYLILRQNDDYHIF